MEILRDLSGAPTLPMTTVLLPKKFSKILIKYIYNIKLTILTICQCGSLALAFTSCYHHHHLSTELIPF